jgi:hypothetical protein
MHDHGLGFAYLRAVSMACAAAECSSWAPEHAAFSTPGTVETWHLSPKSFSIIKHELMFQAEALYMTGGMHAQK